MKRLYLAASLVLAVVVLSVTVALACGCCGSKNKAPSAPPKAKVVSAVCPVMGNKIPDVRRAAGKSVYKGKTYYFCCSGCKPLFDKNPGKYVNKKK